MSAYSGTLETELSFEYKNKRWNDAYAGLDALSRKTGVALNQLTPELKETLKQFAIFNMRRLADIHSGSYPGATGPGKLSRRSGRLRSALLRHPDTRGTSIDDIEVEITAPFYAIVHENGATITAKSGYLTIPLAAALNANGTPKRPSARHWDRTFVQRSKKGNLLIFRKEGARIVPLYVLKRSVKIPPRLGLQRLIAQGVPEFVDVAMSRLLDRMANEFAS